MIGCSLLVVIEIILGLPALELSPVLAVFSGMVFLVNAGILSGMFYIPAAMFMTAVSMAPWPRFALTMSGIISGSKFLIPGLIYHIRPTRPLQMFGPTCVSTSTPS